MDAQFQQWLDDRAIDIQSIEPEIQASLIAQFQAEQRPNTPQITPANEVLIMPVQCQWPQRCYRVEVPL